MSENLQQQELRFDGPAYNHELDSKRLKGQLLRIWKVMKDRRYRTLREIADITGDPESSISAQLRHLRKERFGAHEVKKRRRGGPGTGLFEYQLVPNE